MGYITCPAGHTDVVDTRMKRIRDHCVTIGYPQTNQVEIVPGELRRCIYTCRCGKVWSEDIVYFGVPSWWLTKTIDTPEDGPVIENYETL